MELLVSVSDTDTVTVQYANAVWLQKPPIMWRASVWSSVSSAVGCV